MDINERALKQAIHDLKEKDKIIFALSVDVDEYKSKAKVRRQEIIKLLVYISSLEFDRPEDIQTLFDKYLPEPDFPKGRKSPPAKNGTEYLKKSDGK